MKVSGQVHISAALPPTEIVLGHRVGLDAAVKK
jgi:hypothetical protein